MPAANPAIAPQAAEALVALGAAVRRRRKDLRISAVAAAESAGMSRVTLHRIEKGEPSVTMGAYMAAFGALGLAVKAAPQDEPDTAPTGRNGWIPSRVRIADYPRLKDLAWQVQGGAELSPREALDIYERNWRHLDPATLSQDEADLVAALRLALGGKDRV